MPISRDEKFEWLALHGVSAAPLVCDYAIGADELARRMGRFLWDGLDTLSGLDIEALTKVNCLLRVIRGSEVLPESTNQRSD